MSQQTKKTKCPYCDKRDAGCTWSKEQSDGFCKTYRKQWSFHN